jgi:hypothetical protein
MGSFSGLVFIPLKLKQKADFVTGNKVLSGCSAGVLSAQRIEFAPGKLYDL